MNPIDTYINKIENSSERAGLENLRKIIHEILPNAQECISYNIPAFRANGECVAGFARFKNHLSFFPFSGNVLSHFEKELKEEGLTWTKSGVHFTVEKPIPRKLLEKMMQKRLEST